MVRYKLSCWRELLQEALSESDTQKLPEKIALAEVAVCRRLERVGTKPHARAEQQGLKAALASLRSLKERHFPGWNSHSLVAKTSR